MRRRQVIKLLGGVAAAWPLAARAQQSAMPVVGFLYSSTMNSFREFMTAFNTGLAETGYVEGHNVAFKYRLAENHFERLPALADDLVRDRVGVISRFALSYHRSNCCNRIRSRDRQFF